MVWQEDESSNQLSEESLTLTAEDKEEGRVMKRDSQEEKKTVAGTILFSQTCNAEMHFVWRKQRQTNLIYLFPRETVCFCLWFLAQLSVLLDENIFDICKLRQMG